ncbi:MAG: hypothetical protein KC910_26810, partial [Candidatus Eremiobacteraeota bacterium]|nr:hypothetical protein [Candidatus Eremiobacteraeota bacterium]
EELLGWNIPDLPADRIRVIPCCCDLSHFDPANLSDDLMARLCEELDLQGAQPILVYLGSLGTWYCLDPMLDFFKRLLKRHPRAIFLVLTHEPSATIEDRLANWGIPPEAIRVRAASRDEVPALLSLANIGISFIKPARSKKASSPTKLGEMLALGLPVISNAGVGDSEFLNATYDIGPLTKDFSDDSLEHALQQIPGYLARSPADFREVARDYFALSKGVASYLAVYESLRPSSTQEGEGRNSSEHAAKESSI